MRNDIDFLTAGLQNLIYEARQNSQFYAMVRLSVLGFGATVTPHLELCDVRELEDMPALLATEEHTRYDLVFQDLRLRLDRDVDHITAQGHRTYRPIIYFLTDGRPNPADQPWRAALAALRDNSFELRPNIVAFGVRDADPAIISDIASRPDWAFIARERSEAATGEALRTFIDTFAHTMVGTGSALLSGQAIVPVTAPEGYMSIEVVRDVPSGQLRRR
jgi:uncharacterized protein YegL